VDLELSPFGGHFFHGVERVSTCESGLQFIAILFFSFSFLSKLFGDKYPSPECLRVGLYHDSIQVNMASLASVLFFQERLSMVRQVKYLNNIVEQDHRAVKRITKLMLGFKSFQSAKNILAGIELMHMIRKGQKMMEGADKMSFAEQFYALAE
jgi:hypothetical protein